jgi:hypothetical protein
LQRPVSDFARKLAYSQGFRLENDLETIRKLIDGCAEVRKTNGTVDRTGVDYIATLRGGATIGIDAKTRELGCSEFWQHGEPEFAPEIWSVRPGGKYQIPRERARPGWTLDEAKATDYIFCTFDPADTERVYLLPFQLYRMAFRRNVSVWRDYYKKAIQDSGSWESMCVFVPASIVLNAIYIEMEAYRKLGQLELFKESVVEGGKVG